MNDEKENKELDLFLPSGYDAVEQKQTVVDTQKGTVSDIKDMPPLEQIRLAAQRSNVEINDAPKKSCKHCYERGYIGFNPDKSPVPCNCMFPKKTLEQKKEEKGKVPLVMLPKKIQRKYFRQKAKELRKEIRSESTQRELRLLQERLIKERLANSDTSGTDVSATGDLIQKESEENNGVNKG